MNWLGQYFECRVCHVFLTALLLPVFVFSLAYAQQYVLPFDDCTPTDARFDGYTMKTQWECEVYRRYPVEFSRRIVHMESGYATPQETGKGKTLQVGRFPLLIELAIPPEVRDLFGRWCMIVGVEVQYNVLHTALEVYPPACAELKE